MAWAGPTSYKALQVTLVVMVVGPGIGALRGGGQLDTDCREYLWPTEKRAVHSEKREMGRDQASLPAGTHPDPQAISMTRRSSP